MTTSIPPNLHQQFPQWNALPPEMKARVCEKVMISEGKEAEQRNPALTQEQVALASARALVKLKLVSKEFQGWQQQILIKNPDVRMETNRHAIKAMAASNLSVEEFGQKMDELLAQNRHVSINLLPLKQHQIVLKKLSELKSSPLKKVILNFSCREGGERRLTREQLKEVMDALTCMNRNHPELEIGLDLSDHQLGLGRHSLESATLIADALRQYKLIRLNLCGNHFGEDGLKIIADALPWSKVTDLNLERNFSSIENAKAFIYALPQFNVTNLNLRNNSLGVIDARHLANMLPESKITSLVLSLNVVGVDGVKAIVDALHLSKLTHLDLRSMGMPDLRGGIPEDHPVVPAIINALFQSKVTDLNLSDINFRDGAIQAIRTAGIEAGRQRNEAIRIALRRV